MASGHLNRIKRPNTWLHRPMLQNREESSCQTGAVHTWHKAAVKGRAEHVRSARVFQTSTCSAIPYPSGEGRLAE